MYCTAPFRRPVMYCRDSTRLPMTRMSREIWRPTGGWDKEEGGEGGARGAPDAKEEFDG